MRFLQCFAIFILLSYLGCTAAIAQTVPLSQEPYRGGSGAGTILAEMPAAYTLSGTAFLLPVFTGGSGNGSAASQQQAPALLSGAVVPQVLYQGGLSGGHTVATSDTTITFTGERVSITLFQGGQADGAAAAKTKNLQLNGDALQLSLFFGGDSDGWAQAMLPEALTLQGEKMVLTLFQGGQADGAAAATATDITLTGVALDLTLYKGSAADGAAMAAIPAAQALDGDTHMPALFVGGAADGGAMAAAKNQTLEGELHNMAMFNGGSADGWAIYTSKSQSLHGVQQELVLFKGGGSDGFAADVYLPDTPLPVELVYFRGARTSHKQVELHWLTASESQNAGFEVWRQNTGGGWHKIASQPGKGTTQRSTSYTYSDTNSQETTTYYKLRQLDHDSTATFSKVIFIPAMQAQKPAAIAWPIPVQDYLNVQATAAATQAELRLYSSKGRLLLQKHFEGSTQLDMRQLAAGLYLLQVAQAGQITTVIKIIKPAK